MSPGHVTGPRHRTASPVDVEGTLLLPFGGTLKTETTLQFGHRDSLVSFSALSKMT